MGPDAWISLAHPRAMPPTRPATPTKEERAHRNATPKELGWFLLDRRAGEPQFSPLAPPGETHPSLSPGHPFSSLDSSLTLLCVPEARMHQLVIISRRREFRKVLKPASRRCYGDVVTPLVLPMTGFDHRNSSASRRG